MSIRKIRVIDSHTGGEPTRVSVAGIPELGAGTLKEKLDFMRTFHDDLRLAMVKEPRGSEVMVGALLLPPSSEDAIASVIYFDNAGYLGMCGHGTMGVVATLAYLGRIQAGTHRIDTPVGKVTVELHADGSISIENIPSYRSAQGVRVAVAGYGEVTGSVAWGGNWFFLIDEHPFSLTLEELDRLTDYTIAVRRALAAQLITGDDGAEIEHVILYAASTTPGVHSRNFVLCPGFAYDRSPCGTGTSARLACLSAEGKLAAGEVMRQESFIGSIFEGSYRTCGQSIIPRITGTAFVTADAELILNSDDPFCFGFPRQ